MKIDSSYVNMGSSRKYASVSRQSERFIFGQGSENVQKNLESFGSFVKSEMDDDATAQMEDSMLGLRQGRRDVKEVSDKTRTREEESLQTIKTRCIFFLIRSLFSMKSKNKDLSMFSETDGSSTQMNYQSTSYYAEEEQTSFKTSGSVVTADGRTIDFGINLNMSRSFSEYYEENFSMGNTSQLLDPLVINLDGSIPSLSDQTFLFDLDADGTDENMRMPTGGSGFLALDQNGDGKINDGTELFGPKSGDGFGDLSMYDEDGNGWIDENDEIFNRLSIWTKDSDGNDVLYKLAEKGVGAICLKNVGTQFSLNDANNMTRGIIRSTGMFLYENGGAGTLMHLDVAT